VSTVQVRRQVRPDARAAQNLKCGPQRRASVCTAAMCVTQNQRLFGRDGVNGPGEAAGLGVSKKTRAAQELFSRSCRRLHSCHERRTRPALARPCALAIPFLFCSPCVWPYPSSFALLVCGHTLPLLLSLCVAIPFLFSSPCVGPYASSFALLVCGPTLPLLSSLCGRLVVADVHAEQRGGPCGQPVWVSAQYGALEGSIQRFPRGQCCTDRERTICDFLVC